MRALRLVLVFAFGLLTVSVSSAGPMLPPVPAEYEPLYRAAREHFEQKEFARAEKSYRKLVALAPDDIRFLGNLAVTLYRREKFSEAEEHLKKAVALVPEDAWSHRTLGIVYYSKDQRELARRSLEEAIRLDPQDATAHNYLGITVSKMGFNEQAAEELKTAINADGSYADAYFNLALVLLIQRKPDPENARAYYERALKLGATPDDAMERLLGWADENGIRMASRPLTPEAVDHVRSILLARR